MTETTLSIPEDGTYAAPGQKARYLTCAETARIVRGILKRSFPGQKFSVRSSTYSMSASIDVSWIDGPSWEDVSAAVAYLSGSGFDGMIDMSYSISHWLSPDGTVTLARSSGTVGSRGTHEGFSYPRPAGAELVHMGADHVHCQRRISDYDAKHAAARAWLTEHYVKGNWDGREYVLDEDARRIVNGQREGESIKDAHDRVFNVR